MESASGTKETGEQSAVVAAPMKRCEGCGKPTRIKCSKCNFFAYCSKRCQRKLWPRHKYVCKRIMDIDINPDACALFGGVGDPVWERSQRKLDSARIRHMREIGEEDPDEHPDYILILPLPELKCVIEYLDVKSLCRLDSVVCNKYTLMAWHEALRDTYSAALSAWPRNTNEDGFACLKWCIQRRVELRDVMIWRVVDRRLGGVGGVRTDKGFIFQLLCMPSKKKNEKIKRSRRATISISHVC